MIAICIICFSVMSYAQGVYKTGSSKADNMKMSGTSTFHNWTMSSGTFSGEAQFGFASGGNKQLTGIKSLTFTLPVEDLKGSEKGLDKNAYEALKSGQYKDITYKLTSAQVMPANGGKYMVKTKGDLTIAGITKTIVMNVYCIVNKDGSITCTGSDKLKMTDYSVKPPKFMMGAMTTGDDITLAFTSVYKQ